MGKIRRQECMYSVIQSPDGGFVVVGNNSSNFDDCYIAKLNSVCKNIVINTHIFPFDEVNEDASGTISIARLIMSTASACTLRAGVSIRSNPGAIVTIPRGARYRASVDKSISCLGTYPSIKPSGPSTDRLSEANNLSDFVDEVGEALEESMLASPLEGLEVYPNPSTGIVYLSLKSLEEPINLNLKVLDIMGKVVQEKSLGFNSFEPNQVLDLHNLPSGIYVLQFRNASILKSIKLILN